MARGKNAQKVNTQLRTQLAETQALLDKARRDTKAVENQRDELRAEIQRRDVDAHPAILAAEAKCAALEEQIHAIRTSHQTDTDRLVDIIVGGIIRCEAQIGLTADEWGELRKLAGPTQLLRLMNSVESTANGRILRRNLAKGPTHIAQTLNRR